MEKRSPKTFYFLTILCTVLIINFGCSDEFFTEKAGDRITPDQHYSSIIDLQVSYYGAIMPLQDIMPRLIMLDGLRSDMMDVTPYADGFLNEINNELISTGNPFINVSDLYKIIINVNEVLANIDKVAEKDKRADSLYIRAVTGGLLGMRSWSYLTIARMYGKAAYIDGNLTSLPANLEPNYINKEALIDTLINQIKPYIHDKSTGTQYVEFRIGGYVNNKALLGELYLEKNDYIHAVEYLKKACESFENLATLFKVDATYDELAWASIFLNAETQDLENICVVPYSSDQGQFNPLANWTGVNNQYMVKPTDVLIDSFNSQVSLAGSVGDQYRGMGVTFYSDTIAQLTDTTYLMGSFITKYQIPVLEAFSSDIIISRAGDIHLLLAEAYNRMGDPVSQQYALMLLNGGAKQVNPKPPGFERWTGNVGIRGRASLAARVVPVTMLDPDSIMITIEDFIIAERAMELAFEGKRWNDLVRIAERRGTPEYLADKVAAKFADPGKAEQIRIYLMDPSNWYFK